MTPLKANGLPLLIGSLPMDNHDAATELVMAHTPEVPLWVQLPVFREEGMVPQFLPGMPGLRTTEGKSFIDTTQEDFDEAFLHYFETYLSLSEQDADLGDSLFAFTKETGRGFAALLKQVDALDEPVVAIKGQVTGPITFCTGVKDEAGRDIFYHDQLRDAAVKKLAMNARWQAREFAARGAVPIVFLDEPVLAGFGTSAYITITREDVTRAMDEIIREIHALDGLAGVHVCANTEWDMLLESGIDVISFDAFSYFDRFILYPDAIRAFLNRGGILAFGIVPTGDADLVAQQTTDGLVAKLEDQIRQVADLGFSRETILAQSFVTPSCGTGSLDLESAKKVLALTRAVSDNVRI